MRFLILVFLIASCAEVQRGARISDIYFEPESFQCNKEELEILAAKAVLKVNDAMHLALDDKDGYYLKAFEDNLKFDEFKDFCRKGKSIYKTSYKVKTPGSENCTEANTVSEKTACFDSLYIVNDTLKKNEKEKK